MPLTGERKREYMRRYSAANRERENARFRQWYHDNKETALANQKAYAKSHPEINRAASKKYREKNAEAVRARKTEWARKNRAAKRDECNAKARAWKKHKRATDPCFRIACRLRSRLEKKLRGIGGKKFMSALDLTGCTTEFLRGYLEGLFKPGMQWNNIHIDHIKPVASFDLRDPDQQLACFHYTNLQPLFGADNLKKGAKT